MLKGTALLVLAVPLVVLAACRQPPVEHPNVVLISVDSLRADHLPIYGYERETSPHLDRLAADSVVFETAYSTSSWTLPSHLSMLTGLYPEAHGVQHDKRRLGDDAVLVSEVLQELGYSTAAVVAGPYVGSEFGFDQGWDVYDDDTIRFGNARDRHGTVTGPREHRRVIELLDDLEPGPFFLFVHYWDVHYDYSPPAPWDRRFDPGYSGELTGVGFYSNDEIRLGMDQRDLEWILSLYDGEIAFTDHHLGLLVEELQRRGLYRDALIVFVADHGDEFFEHGTKGHRANLYDVTLRVPLVIKYPRNRWAGSRSRRPVSVVDIAPSILEVVGSDRMSAANGRSLARAPKVLDSARQRDLFADLNGLQKAVIRDGWKLVLTHETVGRPPELFDLRRDPGERRNLFEQEPERAAAMAEALNRWLAVAAKQQETLGQETIEYDDETRQALESLGYLD